MTAEKKLITGIKIAAAFCLVSTAACSENKVNAPVSSSAAVTPVVPQETPVLTGQFPPEIDQYYPELERSGVILRSADSISSISGVPTRIYNYSDANLNPEAAMVAYAVYENMMSSVLPQYKIEGRKRDLVLSPRPAIKKRTTALVPASALLPAGAIKTSSVVPAGTYIDPVNNNAFSYIQLERGASPSDITVAFATMACQQTIQVGVRDQQGREVIDEQERRIAQLVACTSLGTAVAAAELGLSYEGYSSLTEQPITVALEREKVEYPHIQLRKEDYYLIRKTGPIVQ